MAATLPEAETGEEPALQRRRLRIRPEARNAIVVLFRFIFVLRTCALPALSAAGAVVAILTDNDGRSLTGGAPARRSSQRLFPPVDITHAPSLSIPTGVSVLFSFVVLKFVARLDESFGKIVAGPKTVRRCNDELLNQNLDNRWIFPLNNSLPNPVVKIHWLWNRFIAILFGVLGTISVLGAEKLMGSPFVHGLRNAFFQYPWNSHDANQILNRGSRPFNNDQSTISGCNQLYQSLVVCALFATWQLASLNEVKRVLVGPRFQIDLPNCLQPVTQDRLSHRAWTTRSICSGLWCTNALKFLTCVFIDHALTFCFIWFIWLALAVWFGGVLTISGRVGG